MSYRLHKVKHLPLLDFLHFQHILQRNFVEMLPHAAHLVVRLKQKYMSTGLSVKTFSLWDSWKTMPFSLTSWSCVSFFLAERLRCFSRTAQYFSVSLSYLFLASCHIQNKKIRSNFTWNKNKRHIAPCSSVCPTTPFRLVF